MSGAHCFARAPAGGSILTICHIAKAYLQLPDAPGRCNFHRMCQHPSAETSTPYGTCREPQKTTAPVEPGAKRVKHGPLTSEA